MAASRDELVFTLPLADLEQDGHPIEYAAAHRYFQRGSIPPGAAYILGAFLVLMRERGVNFGYGVRILISSDVPEGKGVSSSAAVEVTVMQAVAAAYDLELTPRELAPLCQWVENLVVGAPCGVMDQMTSVTGETNRLLPLLCQSAESLPSLAVPGEIAFWGLDSGVRHSVAGDDYGSLRVGAFMGYRIIAGRAGLLVTTVADQLVEIEDEAWRGYLANITPDEFERRFAAALPETIGGGDFLRRYQGTPDPVTRIDPARTYRVRMPTGHPIYEHHRTGVFSEAIGGSLDETELRLLGNLMYESHASYSACGLGSDGTDLLVQLVREAGILQGLYGAKITGGGSGGTVAVLGRRDAGHAVESVAVEYERRTGHRPYIFAGSSPGSAAFGHIRLQ